MSRVAFIDNLRYAVVLAVVAFHASVAYFPDGWWYVRGPELRQEFALVAFVVDAFAMPFLFFFAGYFASPALRRRTVGGFITAKANRLLLPFCLLSLFLNPVMPWLHVRLHGNDPIGFAAFWWGYVRSIFDGQWVIQDPTRATETLSYVYEFNQHHLWFIALLFVFFVVWAFLCGAKDQPGSRSSVAEGITGGPVKAEPTTPADAPASSGEIVRWFLGVALVLAIMQAILGTFLADTIWVDGANLFLLQPARVPFYIGLFALGTLAQRREWFVEAGLPGPVWLWSVAAFISLSALMVASYFCQQSSDGTGLVGAVQGVARTGSLFTISGLLLVVGYRYWKSSGPWDRALAASSYHIYLVHLPILVLLHYSFIEAPLPLLVKFLAATALAAGASFLLSRYLIQPRPVLAVVLLLLGFVGLCLEA